MKKLLLVGALALTGLAATEQPASAWCNFKFGCGLNMEWSSGCNSFCWGLWQSGQAPGCCAPGCCPPGGMPYGGPFYGPMGGAPDFGMPGHDFGYGGPAPTGTHPVQYNGGWNGDSGYQPVNYGGYGW